VIKVTIDGSGDTAYIQKSELSSIIVKEDSWRNKKIHAAMKNGDRFILYHNKELEEQLTCSDEITISGS